MNDNKSDIVKLSLSICLLIITLYILSNFIDHSYAWGFNYWSEFPLFVSISVLLLCFIFVLLLSARKCFRIELTKLKKKEKSENKSSKIALYGFISISLFIIFMAFRCKAHFYGDGYTLLSGLSKNERAIYAGKLYLESASVLLNYYAIKSLGWFGITPETAFAASSSFAGVIAIWGLYKIAALLTDNGFSKWLIFAGSLTSGGVILFFGYIENYTWMNGLGLWSLYWSIKYLKGYDKIWPSIFLACLAVSFHISALSYLVLSIMVYILKKTPEPQKLVIRISLLFILTPFVITNLLKILELPQILVPLLPYTNYPY